MPVNKDRKREEENYEQRVDEENYVGKTIRRERVEPWRPALLARRIARGFHGISRPPTVLLRAKWLIIIIIILYFLRFIEAPKPPKSKKLAKLI